MSRYLFIIFFIPLILQAQRDSMTYEYNNAVWVTTRSQEIQELNKELTGIRTAAAFINYYTEHAADYSDFDSLYTRIYNKLCPKNYSYNLLHGQLNSYPAKVEKSFLYLLFRNYNPRSAKNKSNPLPEDYMLLREAFKKHIGKPRKDSSYIVHYNFEEARSSCRAKDSTVKVSKGFFTVPHTDYFDETFTFFDGVTRLPVATCKGNKEVVWWKIEPDAKSIPVDPDTPEERAMRSYMRAQFFNDIAFVKVNGRFVWLDISR